MKAIVVFQSVEDAAKVDLTRVGAINSRSRDGLSYGVDVEPATVPDALWAGLAAAGVFADVTEAS